MGIVAAHPQVVPWCIYNLSGPSSKLLLGFSFVDISRLLTPPCVPGALLPYFWGDFAISVPLLAAKMCLWEVSSFSALGRTRIPDDLTPIEEKSQLWGAENCEHVRGEGNGFFLTGKRIRGKQGACKCHLHVHMALSLYACSICIPLFRSTPIVLDLGPL